MSSTIGKEIEYAKDSAGLVTIDKVSSIKNSEGKASYNFTKTENWSVDVSKIQFIPT